MSSETFEVFYDGDCPLCVREIKTLRKLDRKDRIVFTDIAAQGFDARVTGLSQGELMASIRGRMPDGTLVEGVEVFRQLYGAHGTTMQYCLEHGVLGLTLEIGKAFAANPRTVTAFLPHILQLILASQQFDGWNGTKI